MVVVAPTAGCFRPAVTEGQVAAGAVLGHVTGSRGRADEVRAPVDGTVVGLLAALNRGVRRGQGLTWLRRLGDAAAE